MHACSGRSPPSTVVGIDVGGARKGFHAVALRDGAYAGQLASHDVQGLANWCLETMCASVIAIDAPCRWSTTGRARPCERELMQQGIFCFATPSREKAEQHPSGYFDWMRRGADLYEALKDSHPLLTSLPCTGQRCCFETFPHAITWHLRNGEAKARQKRPQRKPCSPRPESTPHRSPTSIGSIPPSVPSQPTGSPAVLSALPLASRTPA